jgi:D-alanine-D-alanine ligase
VLNIAERAAACLGASGASRVDVLVTEGENEYVLEVNTLPGMTPTSLLPKIAEHAGIAYASLCEMILEGADLRAAGPKKDEARPQSGVTFRERDLELVRKAV